MITCKDLIIGHVKTIELKGKKACISSKTFAVTEIIEVHGLTRYITNVAQRVFPDGTFEPLVVLENLVKEFIAK
jgi:hypothetical protein